MPIEINGSGTITGITAGGLPNGCITADDLATGVGGKILQVQQTLKTDAFSMSNNSFTDVTGMTVDITPSSSTSNILVSLDICYGGQANLYALFDLYRDSTVIGRSNAVSLSNQLNGAFGAACGNNDNDFYKLHNASFTILDTPPSASQITYKIQVYSYDSKTFYLNRPYDNTNYAYIHGGSSSITAMEVAA